jgi:ribosomal protein L39E
MLTKRRLPSWLIMKRDGVCGGDRFMNMKRQNSRIEFKGFREIKLNKYPYEE